MDVPEMPDLNLPELNAHIYDVAGTVASVGKYGILAAAFFAMGYLLFTGTVAVVQYVVSKVSGNR